MKVLHFGIAVAALISLASCGATGPDKQLDYGAKAKQLPSLEVPPDLTALGGDDKYKVPGGDGGIVATFSDYSKGSVVPERAASAVLPEVQGVRLERNGAQRWLVVKDSAEKAWNVVRAFLLEIGLTVSSEEQAAGVIETNWSENRAKIPESRIRSVIGTVFGKAYSTGERDQYLVRLERGKDGSSTEIYVTQRGKVEVFSEDLTVSKWQMRPHEPELEAIMLQRLMVRFGASEAQAASAVAETAVIAAASAVAAAGVVEPAGTASLREVAEGGVVIVMNDAFDRAWRKVGLAIEGAGLAVEDKNREKGIYFLRPIKVERGWLDSLMFWKSDVDTDNHYQVNVKDGGTVCEVSITNQDGASNTVAKQMVEAIYKHIP